jgi:hypothetical protein
VEVLKQLPCLPLTAVVPDNRCVPTGEQVRRVERLALRRLARRGRGVREYGTDLAAAAVSGMMRHALAVGLVLSERGASCDMLFVWLCSFAVRLPD